MSNHGMASGDMNSGGRNDLVFSGSRMMVMLQGSDGRLGTDAASLFTVNAYSPLGEAHIADMNADGRNGIVYQAGNKSLSILRQIRGGLNDLVCETGPVLQVFRQRADHSFQAPILYYLPTQTIGDPLSHESMSVGDVNGDGWPDAVVGFQDEGIFVLLNVPQ